METDQENFSPERVQANLEFLEELVNDPVKLASLSVEQKETLMGIAGSLTRPDPAEARKRRNERKKRRRKEFLHEVRDMRAKTGIRVAREAEVFNAPAQLPSPEPVLADSPELKSPRSCYVCKNRYSRLHFFYDTMCPECGQFNYQKRFQTASLAGRTALITGARLKIGYQATLLLLRAGAQVIATTRFPVNAAQRFAAEEDFAVWGERLHIYGLDLRHTPSVEIFASLVERDYDRLDVLINNAAQTVRRPPVFYQHMLPEETAPFASLAPEVRGLLQRHEDLRRSLEPMQHDLIGESTAADALTAAPERALTWQAPDPGVGLFASARLSQIPYTHDDRNPALDKVFPTGKLDADLQQVDLRSVNSWRLKLGEIDTAEMLELQLINSVAPFVLCNRLVQMMRRDYTGEKHIVNVSAMEGKFFGPKKPDTRHPHTNMAKAALNMLTHTSAADLADEGIFLNAVDTGWVTDEDPADLSQWKQEHHDFQPPLDIVDGAARVCDPLFHGLLTGNHMWGKFLKDYSPIDW